MSIYDFSVKNKLGEDVPLSNYKGKVLLIVNTASKCGFTPQFEGLQKLYETYGNEKFEILGFPCNQFAEQDPGSDDEIQEFCQINYGVTFQIFKKIDVNGENADPLYKYLTNEKPALLGKKIKWNFAKFLIDTEGNVVNRFAPSTKPEKLSAKIEALLN